MRILAIDLGFRFVGWSYFANGQCEDYGCIEPKKNKSGKNKTLHDFENARFIHIELTRIIKAKNFGIDMIVFEMPMGSQNSRAAKLLGMASGVMAGLTLSSGLPYDFVMPMELKKAVGLTEKKDIISFMESKFGLIVEKNKYIEHIADSMAVYYTWIRGKKNGM